MTWVSQAYVFLEDFGDHGEVLDVYEAEDCDDALAGDHVVYFSVCLQVVRDDLRADLAEAQREQRADLRDGLF